MTHTPTPAPRPPRLYLDNNAISGFFDPEWQEAVRELWRLMQSGRVQFVTSVVTAQEIAASKRVNVREHFDANFAPGDLLPVTPEAEELADFYISERVLTASHRNDALHVAVCTVNEIEWLISGNFRHLARPIRSEKFNRANHLKGYKQVSILPPDEYLEKMV